MTEQFSWTAFYEELASKLLEWRDRQVELIAFLEELRGQGRVITPLTDHDDNGEHFVIRS